ncbi:MAG: TolC family protein [Bacteroidales bacterium]
MFRFYVWILCLTGVMALFGKANAQQVITLDKCREMALEGHGFEHRTKVLANEAEARVSYLEKMVRPQVSAFAVFSYQSDVPDPNSALEFGFDLVPLAKDQYRTGVLVKQQLYGGGEFRYKRELAGLDRLAGENDVYKSRVLLENSVDDLFFEILLLNESKKILESQYGMYCERVGQARALHDNGKVLVTQVLQLELALQKLEVQMEGLVLENDRLRGILAAVTGMDIGLEDSLVVPGHMTVQETVADPFYERFDIEKRKVELSAKVSLSGARPRAYIFGVGGYARPGLDLFDNNPNVYGVAGLSLVIPISAWRDHRQFKRVLDYKMELLESARNSAQIERNASLAGVQGEIVALERKIENDKRLVEKCRNIRVVVTKLHNLGEVAAADVTEALTGEANAMVEMERHSLELLRARIRKNRLVTSFNIVQE